jgi:hypothetical protein
VDQLSLVKFTDWRGTPIEVGSRIIYSTCSSNSVDVNEAEVVEIIESDKAWAEHIVESLNEEMKNNGFDQKKFEKMTHWKGLRYKLKVKRVKRPYQDWYSWEDPNKIIHIRSVERVTVITP